MTISGITISVIHNKVLLLQRPKQFMNNDSLNHSYIFINVINNNNKNSCYIDHEMLLSKYIPFVSWPLSD